MANSIATPTKQQIAEAKATLAAAAEGQQLAFDDLTEEQQQELGDALDSITCGWEERVEELEGELLYEASAEMEALIKKFGEDAVKVYLDNNGYEFDSSVTVDLKKVFDDLN